MDRHASTMTDAVELLRRVPLFASLPTGSLKKVARLTAPRSYAAGTTLLEEGTVGLGLVLLTRGRVEVRKGSGDRMIVLAELTEGDILGELALIDDEPRSATAVALEATEALLITRDSFRTLTRQDPEVAWCIAPVLAARLRDLHQRLLVELEDRPLLAPAQHIAPTRDAADARDSAEQGEDDRDARRLLRLPRDAMVAGLVAAQHFAGLSRVMIEAFADELGVDSRNRDQSLGKSLSASLAAAGRRGLIEGLRLPGRWLEDLESTRQERRR